MKFNLLLILILLLASSCGGDDECVQADWVGTFAGTETCDGDTEDAVITVAAVDGDMLSMEVQSSGTTVTIPGIPFDACGINEVLEMDQSTLNVDASLDGDMLTLDTEFVTPFGTGICQYVVTR